VVQLAAANVAQQLMNMSIGEEESFDYRSLLVTVVNAMATYGLDRVGAFVPKGKAAGQFLPNLIGRTARGLANGFVANAARGQRPDIISGAASMVGSELGGAMVNGAASIAERAAKNKPQYATMKPTTRNK